MRLALILLSSLMLAAQTAGNIPVMANLPIWGQNAAGSNQDVDTFVGTAATLLSAHTSDLGHGWAQYANGPDAVRTILLSGTGKVYGGTPGANSSYYSLTVPTSTNYTVTVDCKIGTTGASFEVCGTYAGLDTTAYNTYVALNIGGTCQLYKVISATPTQLGGNSTISCAWANGSTHNIGLRRSGANGTVVTMIIDGVADATATGTGSITLVGKAGIRIDGVNGTVSSLIGNFVIK